MKHKLKYLIYLVLFIVSISFVSAFDANCSTTLTDYIAYDDFTDTDGKVLSNHTLNQSGGLVTTKWETQTENNNWTINNNQAMALNPQATDSYLSINLTETSGNKTVEFWLNSSQTGNGMPQFQLDNSAGSYMCAMTQVGGYVTYRQAAWIQFNPLITLSSNVIYKFKITADNTNNICFYNVINSSSGSIGNANAAFESSGTDWSRVTILHGVNADPNDKTLIDNFTIYNGNSCPVISNQSVPNITNLVSTPSSPKFNDSFYIEANITASNGTYIISVNFTIQAPNGTAIINNVNGSFISGNVLNISIWRSSNKTINQFGTWRYNVTVTDNASNSASSSGSFINAISVTKDVTRSVIGSYIIRTKIPTNVTIRSSNLFNNTDTISAQSTEYQYDYTETINVSINDTLVWSETNTTVVYGSNNTILTQIDNVFLNVTYNSSSTTYTNRTFYINISETISTTQIYSQSYKERGRSGDWVICQINNNSDLSIALGNLTVIPNTHLLNTTNNFTLCTTIAGNATGFIEIDLFNITSTSTISIGTKTSTYVNWTTPSIAASGNDTEYVQYILLDELQVNETSSSSSSQYTGLFNITSRQTTLSFSANSINVRINYSELAKETSYTFSFFNTTSGGFQTLSSNLITFFDEDGDSLADGIGFDNPVEHTTLTRYRIIADLRAGSGGGDSGGSSGGGGGGGGAVKEVNESALLQSVLSTVAVCGNKKCDEGETLATCPRDCAILSRDTLKGATFAQILLGGIVIFVVVSLYKGAKKK